MVTDSSNAAVWKRLGAGKSVSGTANHWSLSGKLYIARLNGRQFAVKAELTSGNGSYGTYYPPENGSSGAISATSSERMTRPLAYQRERQHFTSLVKPARASRSPQMSEAWTPRSPFKPRHLLPPRCSARRFILRSAAYGSRRRYTARAAHGKMRWRNSKQEVYGNERH